MAKKTSKKKSTVVKTKKSGKQASNLPKLYAVTLPAVEVLVSLTPEELKLMKTGLVESELEQKMCAEYRDRFQRVVDAEQRLEIRTIKNMKDVDALGYDAYDSPLNNVYTAAVEDYLHGFLTERIDAHIDSLQVSIDELKALKF